ncbi:DUF2695 domain-containing protein [Microbacterium horticulturae]|uniref:DUF2695 domain-containing protein n=1 Tax=Microbacterium horticulturae TaxID=3028316 RepID=A0ABY8BX89_9MICO|nr:DUF2695 domain-containing protein [Microbacterium sp. KACC 23027]WEG08816.1 DUF2695 domain-containing protein [Microbacterium sp. KACC 23027]
MEQNSLFEAESIVHEFAAALTAPHDRECLPCYLDRVLHDAQCDGTLRFASAYRDAVAPRATGLERRMHEGGGCCDCEILMNVYLAKSDTVTPCPGVRRGSTQPCGLWHRRRRGDGWW